MKTTYKPLWEILVPTHIDEKEIDVEKHKEWDKLVFKITGGLTIFRTVKGKWTDPNGEAIGESMIPVRIACEPAEMLTIASITAEFYCQKAVMYYKISEIATIVTYE